MRQYIKGALEGNSAGTGTADTFRKRIDAFAAEVGVPLHAFGATQKEPKAGLSLRTSTRPKLNLLTRIRVSVRAFTLKAKSCSDYFECCFPMTLLHGSQAIPQAGGGDVGLYGAPVQRRRGAGPRELLLCGRRRRASQGGAVIMSG